MMFGVVANSFTTAGSSMVGQNIGARKYGRVSKVVRCVAIAGLTFSTAFSAFILLFPKAVCEMFTGDQAVLAVSSMIIVPIVLNAYGAATRSPAFAVINGSGNSKLNLIIALLDGIVFRIGLSYLLGFTFGMSVKGFWLGDGFAGWVPMFVAFGFLASGKWKTDRLVHNK